MLALGVPRSYARIQHFTPANGFGIAALSITIAPAMDQDDSRTAPMHPMTEVRRLSSPPSPFRKINAKSPEQEKTSPERGLFQHRPSRFT